MNNVIRNISLATALSLSLVASAWASASDWEHPKTAAPAHEKQAATAEEHLKLFDKLDFDIYTNQKWDQVSESHSNDIVVTWPDGHESHGLAEHIEDTKKQFVYAPDTAIKDHPIRFGSGSWTTATGVMTGTFSKPMPIGDGKFMQPTGKHFAVGMVTVGHWVNGKMDHEWLFWDSADFMKQIGLSK